MEGCQLKRCKVCRKKPRLAKRVNCEGIVFCSDECYEEYEDSPNDFNHPYIDDYDAVRFEYIEWMKSYENDLYRYGTSKKEELIEGIESVIQEFYDYIQLAGSDGIFSMEIYQYLLALEDLKDVILKWEPSNKGSKNFENT